MIVCACVWIPFFAYAESSALNLQKQQINTAKTELLCKVIPDQCGDKPTWTLYKAAEKANQYYLISNLKLYQLEQNKQSYQVLNQWDFSKYASQKVSAQWASGDIDNPLDQNFIYPTLFKMSEKTYAVALVQSFHEGYSGGAMNEEVANFFELIPEQVPKLMFQNIPFSMYRMIRACFSDEDYKKGDEERCHDEENLVLVIRYLKPYTWQMRYHYSNVLSPASDQKPVNARNNFVLEKGKQETIQIPASWSAD